VAILGLVLAAGVVLAIVLIRNDDDGGSSGSTVTVTTGSTSTVTTQPQLVSVPDVGGETQISAVGTVQDAQLVPNTYPVRGEQQRGVVVAQSPSAGSDAQQGSGIRLNVSTGTGDTGTTTVPGVIGSDADDARLTLARGKLCVRTLTRTASSPGDVGNVVGQSPSSGTNVAQYAQVTIYVGT
jgi:serine/threonine-protein kinase